jgi:hypothetical protein
VKLQGEYKDERQYITPLNTTKEKEEKKRTTGSRRQHGKCRKEKRPKCHHLPLSSRMRGCMRNTTTVDEELQSTETIHDASRLLVQPKGNEQPSPHPDEGPQATEATTQQRHRRRSRRASKSRVHTQIASPCTPATEIANGRLRHHQHEHRRGAITPPQTGHLTLDNVNQPTRKGAPGRCLQGGERRLKRRHRRIRMDLRFPSKTRRPGGSVAAPSNNASMEVSGTRRCRHCRLQHGAGTRLSPGFVTLDHRLRPSLHEHHRRHQPPDYLPPHVAEPSPQ